MTHVPSAVKTVLAALVASSCAAEATAPEPTAVIATITWGSGGVLPAIVSSLRFQARYVNPLLRDILTPVTDTLTLTAAHAGKRISITREHPFFENATERLTNGVEEAILLEWYTGRLYSNQPVSERRAFHQDGGGEVDLRGFSIERITVAVDTASFVTPGQNRNGDGVWTDVRLVVRLIFEGKLAER